MHSLAGQALDQLSTRVRPNRRYESDRKDLDKMYGEGFIDILLEQANPTKRPAVPEAISVLKDTLVGPRMSKTEAKKNELDIKESMCSIKEMVEKIRKQLGC